MAKRKAAPEEAGDSRERATTRGRRQAAEGQRLYRPERQAGIIWLRLANRHGLITGATGTGKTVTLQGLAEGFSDRACRCSAPT